MFDIWIYVEQREGEIAEPTFGLTAEALRLAGEQSDPARITAVAMGPASQPALQTLGDYGVDRVLHLNGPDMQRYQGERFSHALTTQIKTENPACLLMAQTAQTEDLAQRTAAELECALVTRSMDFTLMDAKTARAIRPVGNGYLVEELHLALDPAPIVLFPPAVLFDTAPGRKQTAPVTAVSCNAPPEGLKTRTMQVIEAAPEDLDLAEADIIVAGGRGVGKGEAFDVIHQLAKAICGSVGATRPVIDWGTVAYERQIGQTGKYVSPRLIINCGISGANEYTAGMEKSQQVIAIDQNPRARIFRFADLGVVGDLHDILPLLISQIEDQK